MPTTTTARAIVISGMDGAVARNLDERAHRRGDAGHERGAPQAHQQQEREIDRHRAFGQAGARRVHRREVGCESQSAEDPGH